MTMTDNRITCDCEKESRPSQRERDYLLHHFKQIMEIKSNDFSILFQFSLNKFYFQFA